MILVLIILAVYHVMIISNFISQENKFKYLITTVMTLLILLAMNKSYGRLISLLEKYHSYRFKDIYKSLKYFFIIESIGQASTLVYNFPFWLNSLGVA